MLFGDPAMLAACRLPIVMLSPISDYYIFIISHCLAQPNAATASVVTRTGVTPPSFRTQCTQLRAQLSKLSPNPAHPQLIRVPKGNIPQERSSEHSTCEPKLLFNLLTINSQQT
jgi:hypothetical protein